MKLSIIVAIMTALLLTACATTGQYKAGAMASIGPYSKFSGRLIVIEPARRWQVLVNWDGTPERGLIRLTHAASNRIIQLSWHDNITHILDNRDSAGEWKPVTKEEIIKQGVILPPQQLALILSGKLPKSLIQKKPGRWQGKINKTFLKIKWSAENHKLELMDITHGRQAILIIQP